MIHTYLLWEDLWMKHRKWSAYVKKSYPMSSSLHPFNFFVPLVEQVKEGVVSIVSEDRSNGGPVDQFLRDFLVTQPSIESYTTERSFGSGFIFHPRGYILTSEHVIGKSKTTLVKLFNGRVFEAERIASDRTRDYAVLKINANTLLKPLPLGDSEETKVGEWVVSIGSPPCGIGMHATCSPRMATAPNRCR
jgi:S1-C subfamily serine protease